MAVWIEVDLCDGCGRCLKGCPYDAVELKGEKAYILERCTSCKACFETCKTEALKTDDEPRAVPDFSDRRGVWVVAERRSGEITPVSLEILSKARELADSLNQETAVALLGGEVRSQAELLIKNGADKVYIVEHPLLEDYRNALYVRVLEELSLKYQPNIMLIGASDQGRELAPGVAQRVGCGLTADCTELSIDPDEGILLQTRPAFGGNIMAVIANRYSRPQMATVRPGVMPVKPLPDHQGEIIPHNIDLSETEDKIQLLEIIPEQKKAVNLAQAKIIVAGGRGVGGPQGFELLRELADAMGGEIAGTRMAVEEGWISSRSQVGQTGQSVRPDVYVACGISGAIQHRAGMINSKYIIAVNKDPAAPIFQIADLKIVGDLFEIAPEMIRQLRQEKN